MKKKRTNPYLIPVAASLVVGIALGYGLAHFAPELSAALVRRGDVRFNVNQPAKIKSPFVNVEQCKQNCEQGLTALPSFQRGRVVYQKQDPNEPWDKTTHAWCEYNRNIAANFSYVYLCHYHPNPTQPCGRFSERYTNGGPEYFGFALDPNSDPNNKVWFQNCSLVESNSILDPLNSNHFY